MELKNLHPTLFSIHPLTKTSLRLLLTEQSKILPRIFRILQHNSYRQGGYKNPFYSYHYGIYHGCGIYGKEKRRQRYKYLQYKHHYTSTGTSTRTDTGTGTLICSSAKIIKRINPHRHLLAKELSKTLVEVNTYIFQWKQDLAKMQVAARINVKCITELCKINTDQTADYEEHQAFLKWEANLKNRITQATKEQTLCSIKKNKLQNANLALPPPFNTAKELAQTLNTNTSMTVTATIPATAKVGVTVAKLGTGDTAKKNTTRSSSQY